jgi:hypothetical protein
MAPLFESGKMQVRVLPPQFCSVTLTEQLNYAPVAQLEEGNHLKHGLSMGSNPIRSMNGVHGNRLTTDRFQGESTYYQ